MTKRSASAPPLAEPAPAQAGPEPSAPEHEESGSRPLPGRKGGARFGLATRILLPIGAAVLALLALVFILERIYLTRLADLAADETHMETARRGALQLENYLRSTERIIETREAWAPTASLAAGNDPASTLPALWTLMLAHRETGALYIGLANDEFAGYRRIPDGSLQLMESGAHTGYELRFHETDASGQPVRTFATNPDFRASTRPWYQAASASDNALWSTPFRYQALPILALPHSAPIVAPDGERLGVVGANLFLSSFDAFLERQDLAAGAGVFIVDGENRIISSSFRTTAPSEAGGLVQLPAWVLTVLDDFGPPDTAPGPAPTRVLALQIEGSEVTRRYSVRRTAIDGHPGIDWQLYSVLDLTNYVGAATPLVTPASLAAVLLGLLGIAMVVLVVRSSTIPLERLADRIDAFAHGGTEASAAPTSLALRGIGPARETTRLQEAFDKMTSQISELLLRQRDDLQRQRETNRQLDRFARIAQQTDNMVVITDAQGAIIWANAGFEETTGYRLEEALGKQPGLLLQGPDTDPAMRRRIAEAMARREPVSARLLNYRSDRSTYWVELTIQPVQDPQTGVLEFFSIQRDVTAQVQYEARLSLWSTVFEQANWGIITSEGDTPPRVRAVNRAAARMFGYSDAELLGRSVALLFAKPENHDLAAIVHELQERTSVVFEADLQRHDGTVFPALINLTQISRGDELGMRVANIQDLSELRALERQLVESNKLETIGLMASGILHDFNNILNVIQLTAEYGQEAADGSASLPVAELAKLFGEIEAASQRAAGLSRNFLAFTRREAQGFDAVSLGDLAAEVADMVRPGARGVAEIEVQPCTEDTRIWGDAVQLQQVVMNLIGNAVSALREDGRRDGHVIVRARRVHHTDYFPLKDATHWIRLDLDDNGPGIPSRVRARIFEPLFTTRSNHGGTGLGLSIVQRIVENHGGFVACQSTVGSGTCFTVWLPELSETIAGNIDRPAPVPLPQNTRVASERPRVLVVEDEFEMSRLWRTLLKDRGWDLVVRENGESAWQACRESALDFDVLVTDLSMPGISGLDLVERVRETGADTAVLVYSAHVDAASGERLAELGVEVVLHKPVSSRVLVESIEKLLAQRLHRHDHAEQA